MTERKGEAEALAVERHDLESLVERFGLRHHGQIECALEQKPRQLRRHALDKGDLAAGVRGGRSVMANKDIIIGRVINITGMIGVLAGTVLFTFAIVMILFRRGFGLDIPNSIHWFW